MGRKFSMELAGRTITVETGDLAQLANGAVLVRYGDTVVHSTATASSAPSRWSQASAARAALELPGNGQV